MITWYIQWQLWNCWLFEKPMKTIQHVSFEKSGNWILKKKKLIKYYFLDRIWLTRASNICLFSIWKHAWIIISCNFTIFKGSVWLVLVVENIILLTNIVGFISKSLFHPILILNIYIWGFYQLLNELLKLVFNYIDVFRLIKHTSTSSTIVIFVFKD